MPLINDKDGIRVEYTIPETLNIPEYFYYAMVGELASIFGTELFSPVDPDDPEGAKGIEFVESTGGWEAALYATCEKLNLMYIYDYWNTLEYYDSDIFDSILSSRIIKKYSEESSANPYYKYLLDKKEKESDSF